MPPEIALSVKNFLATSGKDAKGELGRLVEDAVHAWLVELTVGQVKAANAGVADDEQAELAHLADEALEWARNGGK